MSGNQQPSIDRSEHIGQTTGDDIEAKRVAGYVWNGSGWQRNTGAPTNVLVKEAHDYLSLSQTATTDTWTYKLGGSGGATVATVTITYTDSTKVTIANVAKT